jgi:hypothetical protein
VESSQLLDTALSHVEAWPSTISRFQRQPGASLPPPESSSWGCDPEDRPGYYLYLFIACEASMESFLVFLSFLILIYKGGIVSRNSEL